MFLVDHRSDLWTVDKPVSLARIDTARTRCAARITFSIVDKLHVLGSQNIGLMPLPGTQSSLFSTHYEGDGLPTTDCARETVGIHPATS
jgi:hypothetical protein